MNKPLRHEAIWPILVVSVFAIFALSMFLASPTDGDFSWSDAPRHALNGVFVKDLLAAMPLNDARGFAEDYYLRYPALAILFYPPLFSLFLAGWYAVFGFSHAVAQAAVAFCHFGLGVAAFALYRRWLPRSYSLAAALLLIGAPEIAYWGRQVMLDIPCYFLLTSSAVFFVRYLDHAKTRDLYWTVLLYVAALYTKQTPLFAALAFGVGLLAASGPRVLKDRRVVGAAVLGIVLLLPLLVMQLKFGHVNVASVVGSERDDLSRATIGAWTYYAQQLPQQMGWATIALACAGLAAVAIRPSLRLPRSHMWFLGTWFVAGYLLFSFVMVREPRHDLMVLLPIPLFAMLAVQETAATRLPRAGIVAAWIVVTATVVSSIVSRPVLYVSGYQEAARLVMKLAPRHSVVLFSGNRDGSFVFNMRAGNRPDLRTARADKVLFRVAIERERGVVDRGMTPEQIEQFIRRHGVRYVVFEPDFWPDLPSSVALKELLIDPARFSLTQEIATQANFPQSDKKLLVFEYRGVLDDPPAPLGVELVGIGRSIGAD